MPLPLSASLPAPLDRRTFLRTSSASVATLFVAWAAHAQTQSDTAEAARWFRAASAQGVPTAQYNLATMYANGIGVPQDLVRAAMWLNLAGAEVEGLDLVRWRGDRQLVLEALSAQELLESQDLSVACINSNFTDCGEP